MSLIIVNGSPRKKGNSQYILEFIKSLLERQGAEYEVIDVKSMDLSYCTGCGGCNKTGWCVIKDDGVEFHKKFDESDATIVISPIYYNSITAQLKTIVDRMQALYASKYVLEKPTIDRQKARYGAFIAVAGDTPYENQFIGADLIMDMFFKVINTSWIEKLHIEHTDARFIDEREEDLKRIEKIVMNILDKINA